MKFLPRLHGRQVRISWVRGHSGHPLNQIADRLALSARRTFEAGLPADSRRLIGHNIVSSLALAHPAA
ncbi:RNase H family protein [Rhodococcus sp. NPDC058521]|uniref:RNase H family protein n=1 Tax=Rhodococcus sp. NPDC058521 TaxID=3346536 RepID=UPI003657B3D4